MARRPAKSPETSPPLSFMPLRADGQPASIEDFLSGEPIFVGPPFYLAGDRRLFLPLPGDWLNDGMAVSAALFSGPAPEAWSACLLEAMEQYFRDRATELHAADERRVEKALQAIEATARKLQLQLDGPKADAKAYYGAWRRIDEARHLPDDKRNLRDELYPAMSLLTGRLRVLRRDGRKRAATPNSLATLVRRLAADLKAFGVSAAGSNGIERRSGVSNLSNLAMLAKIIIDSSGLPPPSSRTDAALNKAVVTALKSRGR